LRRGSIRWPSACALLLALALLAPSAAQARTVRVFAMQPKLDLAWMESRQTYQDKMFALTDVTLRRTGAASVQRGADDVASNRLGAGRDLAVWPEDVGLFGALTGERAASARAAGSFEAAIVSLIGAYAPQNAYYTQRFPEAANRPLPVRLTEVSLTDTYGRTVIETFSELADRYDTYLQAGVNMVQSWQVVCNDLEAFNRASPPRLPGGVLCQEQSPQKVLQLRDPNEPSRDYAYEATTGKVSNMGLVFDPKGRLVSKQLKTYLTPTEMPGQLDLVPGDVTGGLTAVKTPVGTLGIVTSKDAWMPDVQAKLDEAHVDLLVQPEFFVNDLVTGGGMWSPDTLKASGYNNVLRMPSVSAMVLPELTGNIFNFSADAQSHFALKPGRGSVPRGHLVGQPDVPGLDVSPWVVPDPVRAGEPFPERRARLAVAGAALAPGSGVVCSDSAVAAPCENGHVEGVFRRDVQVGVKPRFKRFRGRLVSTPLGRARAVTASRAPQRNVSLAAAGRRVAAAWEERRGGRDRVFVATSRDRGRRWSRAVRVSGGGGDQQWPAVALAAGGRATVAWTDSRTGTPRAMYAGVSGRRVSMARAVDGSALAGAAQWKPALAQGPGNAVHAVWIDERERSADDDLPQAHVYYARLGKPGKRLDERVPTDLAARFDNAWAPRIAARGKRVLVTWLDFQGYDWGVFSRLSVSAGRAFAKEVRVTSDSADQEELADAPDPALGSAGKPLIAWTDWRKRDSAATKPHQQYDIFIASPGGKNRQVDPYGGRQVSTFAPSICAKGKGDAIVAFQDASAGRSVVRAVAMRGGSRRGRARLVSDAGARGGNAWRPRIACSGGRVVAVWEDERDGPPRLYYSSGATRGLW
jgi:predicted amidohydrolase